MKSRSKWLILLLVVAIIAAVGSFVVWERPNDAGESEQVDASPRSLDAKKSSSKDATELTDDAPAPPNALRFVRGDAADAIAVTAIVGSPGHYPPREEVVEKSGYFELPELLETSAWSEGVRAHEVYARSVDNKDAFWSILAANPDADAAPQVVTLQPASPLKVEVVDPAGAPLVGAKVRLSRGLIGLVHQTETTSEDGEVHFGAIPEGDFQLSVYADGFVRHSRHLLHAFRADSEVATTQVVLDRGATVTGRVVDEYGVAVVGAEVAIIPVSPFADEILDANFLAQVGVASQIAKSDARGQFSVGGIATGAVQVRAEAPGYGAGLSALIRVKGNTSTKIKDLILAREVQREDLLIRINLSDASLVLNAVELRVLDENTGREGKDSARRCQGNRVNARDWRFVNCGSGKRELIATTADGVSLRWKGELQNEGEITLDAPRRVEIFVVDALGAPVSGAMVQLWQQGRLLLEATSAGAEAIFYDTAIPFRATLIARDARRGAGQQALEINADQSANNARAVVTLDRGLLELALPPGVINQVEEIEQQLGTEIVQDGQQWIVDLVPTDSPAGQAGIQRGDRILILQRVGGDVEAVIWRGGEQLKVLL